MDVVHGRDSNLKQCVYARVTIHLAGQQQQQRWQQWRRAAEVSGNFIHQLIELTA